MNRLTHPTGLHGLLALGVLAALSCVPVLAQPSATPTTPAAAPAPVPDTMIYGHQLMTPQERTEYRARMWAAESDEARERIRAEHHEQMRVRAQAQGVTLPETPPARPGQAGRRMGPGGGMGPGGRMGAGMGPGMGAGPACGLSASAPCGAGGPRTGMPRRGGGRQARP